jgi:hypothetical protein
MRTAPQILAYVARSTLRVVDQPTWQGVWRRSHGLPHFECVACYVWRLSRPSPSRAFFSSSLFSSKTELYRRFCSAPSLSPTKSTTNSSDLVGHSVSNPFLKVFSLDPLRFIHDLLGFKSI